MKRVRRAPAMIAAAILLPLLIFLAIQFALSAREQRTAVEAEAIARAERILVEADGSLQRTLGALEVLASAQAVQERDWPALYERLQRVRSTNPQWVTAIVTDVATGRGILDLRQPFGAPVQTAGFAPGSIATAAGPFVGDVGGSGPGCPCALVHLPIGTGSRPQFMLTVALDPEPFRRVLLQEIGDNRVVGIVDRHGRFLARSLNHRERLGRLATPYVRNAIAAGPRGIYEGRTFEGFANYSGYSTSPLSGWSAHVAFSRNLLDSPRWRSLAAAGIAALASLLLATVMAAFTMRQLAAGRRVQERLQEAQKMEALGQITGGIAHDFNNLLTPIVGGLEVIARKAQLDPISSRLLESALSAGRRAAKLTGQLLAFSRRQRMEIRPVDLPRLIGDLEPLLAQSVGPGVRIETEVAPEVQCVRSDANQLELALLNLALNARDAMRDGGTLRITARMEPARRGAEAMAAIEVRDTGQGMPDDVLRRATEPFFTTKSSGSGTGLGLSQVYGTVQQSGGSLKIESEPGSGTVVTLRLPACERAPAPPPEAAAGAAEGGASRRVILCDDDDLVRGFAARVLDAAGYVVEAVSDGGAAVEIARRAAVDLLVVDFAMPGMNGAEVMRAVRQIRPAMPILMITGYSDTEAVVEIGTDVPVLRKPFEAGALLAAARDALAGAAAADAGSNGEADR
ncbi:MAG TPA: ATP-binding protein [Allosphingosinicella sp.]|jgi:signal transduction histidine kinase/CheY-like chemotaxis protein|nr:ATP-binding protein [Allosphingosinicella sp.]